VQQKESSVLFSRFDSSGEKLSSCHGVHMALAVFQGSIRRHPHRKSGNEKRGYQSLGCDLQQNGSVGGRTFILWCLRLGGGGKRCLISGNGTVMVLYAHN
jgi:hypothetical protein